MTRDEDRLHHLERAIEEIARLNETVPIVVEGRRDVAALRRLGMAGEVLVVNGGVPLIQFCDQLAERYKEAVVLPDWDRTGGHIMRHLRDNLRGRVRMHRDLRRTLAVHAEVRDVESLPAYLSTLRDRVAAAKRPDTGVGGARQS